MAQGVKYLALSLSLLPAVAWVPSLAWKLLHAMGLAIKKKKRERENRGIDICYPELPNPQR